jgi:acyl dehydratase
MPPLVLETPQALKDFAGREIGTSDWFVVAQDRIHRFAEATEDRQWIHVDRQRAASQSPYGTTIAHGFLTLSLAGSLVSQVLRVRGARMSINYGVNRVRFPAPVPADSRIRARVTVQSVEEFADCIAAVILVSMEGENSKKPCCVAEWLVRYYI